MTEQNASQKKVSRIPSLNNLVRRWSITRRLLVNALLPVAAVILIIIFLGINASKVFTLFDKLINDTTQEIRFFSSLSISVQTLLNETREYALLQQPSTHSEIKETLSDIDASFLYLIGTGAAHETEAEENTENIKLEDLQLEIRAIEAEVNQIISLVSSGDAETLKAATQRLEELEEKITVSIEEINTDLQTEYDSITTDIRNQIIGTLITALIIITASLIIILGFSHLSGGSITGPLRNLLETSRRIADGDLEAEAEEIGKDEISILANAFNRMNARQRDALASEAQSSKNMRQTLEQMRASTQVAQAVATILNPDELITRMVDLIQQAFDLYYVGVFLVDERNEWAVLRAGTGSAGAAMLARGHQIKIGTGMIGWSIANAQARVALEVEDDTIRQATNELPETRSELALPLRSRGRVIGAFTVQDRKPQAFDEQKIAALQTMADQVAVALDNARLFAESQAALEAARRAFGEASQEAWNQYLSATSDIDFLATPQNDRQIRSAEWPVEMAETFQVGDITRRGAREIHIPIILRDQTLGVVRLCKREEAGAWSDEEIELMDTLVDQLETALETARLYSDTQRQAARVRLTQDVTDKLHRSLNMDTLMQTLLQEISAALGASEAFVQLSTPTVMPDSASGQRSRSAN